MAIDNKYIEILNEKCKDTRCNSFLFNFKFCGDKSNPIDIRGIYFSQTKNIIITVQDINIAWSSALLVDKHDNDKRYFDRMINLEIKDWNEHKNKFLIDGKTAFLFNKIEDIFIEKANSKVPLDQPNSKKDAFSYYVMCSHKSSLEEKDKIYYKGRRRNEVKKVSRKNLEKTKNYLGATTYELFKAKNISSIWSNVKTDNSDLIFDIKELQRQDFVKN